MDETEAGGREFAQRKFSISKVAATIHISRVEISRPSGDTASPRGRDVEVVLHLSDDPIHSGAPFDEVNRGVNREGAIGAACEVVEPLSCIQDPVRAHGRICCAGPPVLGIATSGSVTPGDRLIQTLLPSADSLAKKLLPPRDTCSERPPRAGSCRARSWRHGSRVCRFRFRARERPEALSTWRPWTS